MSSDFSRGRYAAAGLFQSCGQKAGIDLYWNTERQRRFLPDWLTKVKLSGGFHPYGEMHKEPTAEYKAIF